MNIFNRLTADTPSFFKKLRNIGLALTAASAVILAAPVALPAAIITAAGYAATAGAVCAAVSQAVTTDEKK